MRKNESRDRAIFQAFQAGQTLANLARKWHLLKKSIRHIVRVVAWRTGEKLRPLDAAEDRPSYREPGYGEPCRHCGTRSINRPRRLCWRCYYIPDVRQKYSSGLARKYQASEVKDFCGTPKAPDEPTEAPPGSPEKIAAMEARALAGRSLFHERDGVRDDEAARKRRKTG